MKRIYLALFLTTCLSVSAFAQITLTSDDVLGWIGTDYVFTEDSSEIISISPGESGPNQLWDFTNVSLDGNISLAYEFFVPSETPFASEFPEANLTQKVSLLGFDEGEFTTHLYGKVTSTEYIQLGSASVISFPFDTTFIEFDPDTISIFPLTYERTWTEVDTDTFDLGGIFLDITKDSTIYTVDAWGTVQLPIGEFDCLRLREEVYTMSMSVTAGVPLPGDSSYYVSYTWISDEYASLVQMTSFDDETELNFSQAEFFGILTATDVDDSNGGGDTTVVDTPETAMVQVIHNAADPAANIVDIYVDTNNDTVLIDDVAFRTATEFIELPAQTEITITVAPSTSTNIGDGLVSFAVTLESDEAYHVVANGVLDPDSFAANPEDIMTDFTLLIAPGARQEAENESLVDIKVLHGSSDAPNVGVNANGSVLIPDFSYKDFVGYASIPADSYQLDITPGGDSTMVIASFIADLSGLDGGAALVIASGFLDSTMNQEGPSFGLIGVFPDGSVVELPAFTDTTTTPLLTTIDGIKELSIYPNPTSELINVAYTMEYPQWVSLEIVDMLGRIVYQSPAELKTASRHQLSLDSQRLQMEAGLYSVALRVGNRIMIQKVVVK